MTPVRLGLAGFGRLARDAYLPALAALPATRLVAVADPLAASREAARVRCPAARVHETLAGLLEAETLDGLLIASPPSSHFASWRRAAAAGLPVFVEKPLLLAHELARLSAADAQARVMVNFNRRFWPPYARARAAVTSGVLGAPVTVEFVLHLDVLGWSTVTRHRLAPDEGGLLHDLGSHAIDFAAWLLGETPRAVTAAASTARWPHDRLRLELAFPSGAVARADLAYGARTRERLAAHGPAGRLWLDEPNLALHVRRAGDRPGRLAARAADAAVLAYRALRPAERVGRASVRGALAAFVDGVRRGRPLDPGIPAGVGNARCLAASLRSATSGQPVPIEDTASNVPDTP